MANILHNSFNQGELGPYMDGRSDLEVFQKSAKSLINFMVLPQGGLKRSPGYEFIYKLTDITDGLLARLMRFNVNETQQYLLLTTEDQTIIFRDKSLVSTITTPWQAADLRALRAAQTGDTMIVCHKDYFAQKLKRLDASETAWSIEDIIVDPYPFFRFNIDQTCTPSAISGSITLTLNGTEGYWNAGHTESILWKANDAAKGAATITGVTSQASGGTAYSSAGTAGNAFDGNNGTDCSAGVDGWVGYDFTSTTVIRVVGIRTTGTPTLDLVFETDDNSSFSSATTVGTHTMTAAMTASTWTYFDVPRHTGENFFRVRETGGADLDVEEIILSKGLIANATTTANLTGTSALTTWTEQAWGPHHGYPRTAVFLGNRLLFCGTRDEPGTTWFSKDGDLFNFDDTDTKDDNAFARTLSTDQNHFIRSVKADREGIVFYTSDGRFVIDGDGSPISPTNAPVKAQSNEGVSTVDITEIDGQMIFGMSNGKQIKNNSYKFADDKYTSGSLTTLAHHLFVDNQKPRALTTLKSFADTQANMLFVPREDGTMSVLTLDFAHQVQAWWNRTTPSTGKIYDSVVVNTVHTSGDDAIDTVYSVVQRTVNGTDAVFLEAITEEDIWLDHWYVGEVAVNRIDGTPIIADGGTGYTVDDVLTLAGGTSTTAATVTVSSVSGGVIDGITVSEVGDYSVLPDNDVGVTGGTGGDDAEFTVTWELIPKTGWGGLTTLANSTVQVVGDGFFMGSVDVDGSGNFTTPEEVTQIYAGLHYDSDGEIHIPARDSRGQLVKGKPVRLIEAIIDVKDATTLSINGYPVNFRQLGDELLDQPLPVFTGQKSVSISSKGGGGTDKALTVKFQVNEPVGCTILTLAVKTR